MRPVDNVKVVDIARSLNLQSYKIISGDPADLYVIATPWEGGSDEAYLVGDIMCAVVERLWPLLEASKEAGE